MAPAPFALAAADGRFDRHPIARLQFVDIPADRDHFSVAARANDVDKTLVAISGP